jgi:hypothetical protein
MSRRPRGPELALNASGPRSGDGFAVRDARRHHHRILRIGSLILAVILTCCASEANASEYGISTYRPGIMDLFSGYHRGFGDFDNQRLLLFQEASGNAKTPNGALTVKSRATSYTDATFVSHTSDYNLLGAHRAYGGLIQAMISDQSLRFGPTAHLGAAQNETVGGPGYLELLPEMLAWKLGKFHLMEGFAGYVPTGSYDEHRAINIGDNRWAIEPDIGLIWMDPDTRRHFSLFTGSTINAENTATHYHRGRSFTPTSSPRSTCRWATFSALQVMRSSRPLRTVAAARYSVRMRDECLGSGRWSARHSR